MLCSSSNPVDACWNDIVKHRLMLAWLVFGVVQYFFLLRNNRCYFSSHKRWFYMLYICTSFFYFVDGVFVLDLIVLFFSLVRWVKLCCNKLLQRHTVIVLSHLLNQYTLLADIIASKNQCARCIALYKRHSDLAWSCSVSSC